jgi:hypothetical protein
VSGSLIARVVFWWAVAFNLACWLGIILLARWLVGVA